MLRNFGQDAVRPKSLTTIPIVEHYVRDYLTQKWGETIADEITPLQVHKWLKSLHDDERLAWTTVSKIKGLMHRVYKIGLRHQLVTTNPLDMSRLGRRPITEPSSSLPPKRLPFSNQ